MCDDAPRFETVLVEGLSHACRGAIWQQESESGIDPAGRDTTLRLTVFRPFVDFSNDPLLQVEIFHGGCGRKLGLSWKYFMYSYEGRIRAVALYIKLGKRPKATIRQLGYPVGQHHH